MRNTNLKAIHQIGIEEKKQKRMLLEFLHLRIFCVGIRQKINMKEEQQLVEKNSELKDLYGKLDLLDILPEKKAIVENEILAALKMEIQNVDMDKLFKEALPLIRDKICRK